MTLTDAATDVEELALTMEDDEKVLLERNSKIIISGLNSALQVPYLVGEIFVLEAPDVVQTMLEKRKYVQSKLNGLKSEKNINQRTWLFFNINSFLKSGQTLKMRLQLWRTALRESRCGTNVCFQFSNGGTNN